MESRKAVGHINGAVQEIFNGIRTIKIFGMEDQFISDFQEPLNQNLGSSSKNQYTEFYISLFDANTKGNYHRYY